VFEHLLDASSTFLSQPVGISSHANVPFQGTIQPNYNGMRVVISDRLYNENINLSIKQ
jgi:hypothetical protein